MSCWRSARFSLGRARDLASMPVLRAFMEEAALPVTEMGPLDFWALRRLASIWRRVDMVAPGPSCARMHKAEPYATFTIEDGFREIGGRWRQMAENRGRIWLVFGFRLGFGNAGSVVGLVHHSVL